MLKGIYVFALAIPFAVAPLAAPVVAQSPLSTFQIAQGSSASMPVVEGEVRRIDKESGKLTLRHGPLPNLDMPAMTMVFRAQDPAMLDRVKVGDKVSFTADKIDGQLTVTKLDKAQ